MKVTSRTPDFFETYVTFKGCPLPTNLSKGRGNFETKRSSSTFKSIDNSFGLNSRTPDDPIFPDNSTGRFRYSIKDSAETSASNFILPRPRSTRCEAKETGPSNIKALPLRIVTAPLLNSTKASKSLNSGASSVTLKLEPVKLIEPSTCVSLRFKSGTFNLKTSLPTPSLTMFFKPPLVALLSGLSFTYRVKSEIGAKAIPFKVRVVSGVPVLSIFSSLSDTSTPKIRATVGAKTT